MPGELRSLAELDEVKDGEDSEDKEEVTEDRETKALGILEYTGLVIPYAPILPHPLY